MLLSTGLGLSVLCLLLFKVDAQSCPAISNVAQACVSGTFTGPRVLVDMSTFTDEVSDCACSFSTNSSVLKIVTYNAPDYQDCNSAIRLSSESGNSVRFQCMMSGTYLDTSIHNTGTIILETYAVQFDTNYCLAIEHSGAPGADVTLTCNGPSVTTSRPDISTISQNISEITSSASTDVTDAITSMPSSHTTSKSSSSKSPTESLEQFGISKTALPFTPTNETTPSSPYISTPMSQDVLGTESGLFSTPTKSLYTTSEPTTTLPSTGPSADSIPVPSINLKMHVEDVPSESPYTSSTESATVSTTAKVYTESVIDQNNYNATTELGSAPNISNISTEKTSGTVATIILTSSENDSSAIISDMQLSTEHNNSAVNTTFNDTLTPTPNGPSGVPNTDIITGTVLLYGSNKSTKQYQHIDPLQANIFEDNVNATLDSFTPPEAMETVGISVVSERIENKSAISLETTTVANTFGSNTNMQDMSTNTYWLLSSSSGKALTTNGHIVGGRTTGDMATNIYGLTDGPRIIDTTTNIVGVDLASNSVVARDSSQHFTTTDTYQSAGKEKTTQSQSYSTTMNNKDIFRPSSIQNITTSSQSSVNRSSGWTTNTYANMERVIRNDTAISEYRSTHNESTSNNYSYWLVTENVTGVTVTDPINAAPDVINSAIDVTNKAPNFLDGIFQKETNTFTPDMGMQPDLTNYVTDQPTLNNDPSAMQNASTYIESDIPNTDMHSSFDTNTVGHMPTNNHTSSDGGVTSESTSFTNYSTGGQEYLLNQFENNHTQINNSLQNAPTNQDHSTTQLKWNYDERGRQTTESFIDSRSTEGNITTEMSALFTNAMTTRVYDSFRNDRQPDITNQLKITPHNIDNVVTSHTNTWSVTEQSSPITAENGITDASTSLYDRNNTGVNFEVRNANTDNIRLNKEITTSTYAAASTETYTQPGLANYFDDSIVSKTSIMNVVTTTEGTTEKSILSNARSLQTNTIDSRNYSDRNTNPANTTSGGPDAGESFTNEMPASNSLGYPQPNSTTRSDDTVPDTTYANKQKYLTAITEQPQLFANELSGIATDSYFEISNTVKDTTESDINTTVEVKTANALDHFTDKIEIHENDIMIINSQPYSMNKKITDTFNNTIVATEHTASQGQTTERLLAINNKLLFPTDKIDIREAVAGTSYQVDNNQPTPGQLYELTTNSTDTFSGAANNDTEALDPTLNTTSKLPAIQSYGPDLNASVQETNVLPSDASSTTLMTTNSAVQELLSATRAEMTTASQGSYTDASFTDGPSGMSSTQTSTDSKWRNGNVGSRETTVTATSQQDETAFQVDAYNSINTETRITNETYPAQENTSIYVQHKAFPMTNTSEVNITAANKDTVDKKAFDPYVSVNASHINTNDERTTTPYSYNKETSSIKTFNMLTTSLPSNNNELVSSYTTNFMLTNEYQQNSSDNYMNAYPNDSPIQEGEIFRNTISSENRKPYLDTTVSIGLTDSTEASTHHGSNPFRTNETSFSAPNQEDKTSFKEESHNINNFDTQTTETYSSPQENTTTSIEQNAFSVTNKPDDITTTVSEGVVENIALDPYSFNNASDVKTKNILTTSWHHRNNKDASGMNTSDILPTGYPSGEVIFNNANISVPKNENREYSNDVYMDPYPNINEYQTVETFRKINYQDSSRPYSRSAETTTTSYRHGHTLENDTTLQDDHTLLEGLSHNNITDLNDLTDQRNYTESGIVLDNTDISDFNRSDTLIPESDISKSDAQINDTATTHQIQENTVHNTDTTTSDPYNSLKAYLDDTSNMTSPDTIKRTTDSHITTTVVESVAITENSSLTGEIIIDHSILRSDIGDNFASPKYNDIADIDMYNNKNSQSETTIGDQMTLDAYELKPQLASDMTVNNSSAVFSNDTGLNKENATDIVNSVSNTVDTKRQNATVGMEDIMNPNRDDIVTSYPSSSQDMTVDEPKSNTAKAMSPTSPPATDPFDRIIGRGSYINNDLVATESQHISKTIVKLETIIDSTLPSTVIVPTTIITLEDTGVIKNETATPANVPNAPILVPDGRIVTENIVESKIKPVQAKPVESDHSLMNMHDSVHMTNYDRVLSMNSDEIRTAASSRAPSTVSLTTTQETVASTTPTSITPLKQTPASLTTTTTETPITTTTTATETPTTTTTESPTTTTTTTTTTKTPITTTTTPTTTTTTKTTPTTTTTTETPTTVRILPDIVARDFIAREERPVLDSRAPAVPSSSTARPTRRVFASIPETTAGPVVTDGTKDLTTSGKDINVSFGENFKAGMFDMNNKTYIIVVAAIAGLVVLAVIIGIFIHHGRKGRSEKVDITTGEGPEPISHKNLAYDNADPEKGNGAVPHELYGNGLSQEATNGNGTTPANGYKGSIEA